VPTRSLTRRQFGHQLAGLVAAAPLAPAFIRTAQQRPAIPSGVMSGDVIGSSAVIWSRSDRPATMHVEYSTTSAFANARRLVGPTALEDTDFAVKTVLTDLPAGEEIFYRVQFADLANPRILSEPVSGHLRTPPRDRRPVSFVWSGDTVGQGWGIDAARGGMRTYTAMRALNPDFFVHSGDTIYADGPLIAEVKLDDGSLWRNEMTPEKSKVAETIAEFRGNHFYNLRDAHFRQLHAEVPTYFQWDDHETVNNWYPGELLEDSRYQVRDVSLLAARGRRAFFECLPIRPHQAEQVFRIVNYGPLLDLFILDMRTYRGPNTTNRQPETGPETAILGREQLDALKTALSASRATWKIICSDMPIGLVVGDGANYEAVANGDAGRPLGREHEIAELLRHMRDMRVRNVAWITADVHHCSSIHYDPARATFKDFDPFWEFVSGPLHAGTFSPPPLDPTFGPETRFLGIPAGMKPNRPPSEDFQFFGKVQIDGESGALTVEHWNAAGQRLWTVTLDAER
jgi:alkaline phosphatase D